MLLGLNLFTANKYQTWLNSWSNFALGLDVLSSSATLNFLKIRLKHTSANSFNQEDQSTEFFQEVFYNTFNFNANTKEQLFFHTPFTWDGSSNIIVDLSFSNLGNTSSESLKVKGSIKQPKGKYIVLKVKVFILVMNNTLMFQAIKELIQIRMQL